MFNYLIHLIVYFSIINIDNTKIIFEVQKNRYKT